MALYRVTWEIDIDADSPRDAANKARVLQTRDGTTATVFSVQPDGQPGEVEIIDTADSDPCDLFDIQDTWDGRASHTEAYRSSNEASDMTIAEQYRMFDAKRGVKDGVKVSFRRVEVEDTEAPSFDDCDLARKAAFRRGEWHYIGVQAEATITIISNGVGRYYVLTSPGLWGIESDSGEKYLNEVFAEEKAALLADIKKLGEARE